MEGMGIWNTAWVLRILLIIFIGMLFFQSVIYFKSYKYPMILFRDSMHDFVIDVNLQDDGFTLNTPGCRIPYLDAFSPKIKSFIFKYNATICNKGAPALLIANDTHLKILETSYSYYRIQFPEKQLRCCYRAFWRCKPDDNKADNCVKYANDCKSFNKTAQITDEFVKVECTTPKGEYKDYFSFVPIIWNAKKKAKHINVLMIGLDAISRLNFLRQMPKTVKYLKVNLSAVDLLAYNKVGDNTYPNMVPVLTGLSEYDLEGICYKQDRRFDQCPFIWKNFSDMGYVTAYGEDSAAIGIFTYLKNGFEQQPTDYYWSIFDRIAENEVGNNYLGNTFQCIKSRQTYQVLVDYIAKFSTSMTNAQLPYFAFFWQTSLSHDYLNKPQIADHDYYELLRSLYEKKQLENTILFLMSDHGMRWGDIRETYQGRMEERLPFVFIVVPQLFKQKYKISYSNLKQNAHRLTSPYDLHETLKDILNPNEMLEREDATDDRISEGPHGISLFNEISTKRTCYDAGINNHWCTCQESSPLEITNKEVIKVADFIVRHVNKQLAGYEKCAKLQLLRIKEARKLSNGKLFHKTGIVQDYMITLETTPGHATFESTVRKEIRIDDNLSIVGTVSRLNLYGNQSACINDFHLKLYCFCLNGSV